MLAKNSFLIILCGCMVAAVPVQKSEIDLNIPADEGLKGLETVIGGLTDRLGNAYVVTYNEEKQSMENTLESVKHTGQMGVETGVNLVKNGLEFIFLVPTFAKNMFSRSG